MYRFAYAFRAVMTSVVITSTILLAQTGIPPFASMSGGGFDLINNANLNLHITIPVLSKPGRGIPFHYAFTYDGGIYADVANGVSHKWTPMPNFGWRGISEASVGYIGYHKTVHVPTQCGFSDEYSYITYHDGAGTPHFMNIPNSTTPSWPACQPYWPSQATLQASDGSGLSITVSVVNDIFTLVSLTDVSGNSIVAPLFDETLGPPVNPNGPGSITDASGNQVSTDGSHFTDSIGYQVLSVTSTYDSAGRLVQASYGYTGGQGSTAVNVLYSTYSINTNFGCQGISDYPATTNQLPSTIQLPDGSSYAITYEQTPNVPNKVTGRISAITLPTGGNITYTYGAMDCSDHFPSSLTVQRSTDSTHVYGVWTYTRTSGGGQTTIVDPGGNNTVITNSNGSEVQRSVYQGTTSGALLDTKVTCYNTVAASCSSLTGPSGVVAAVTVRDSPNGGSPFQVVTYLNSVSLPTEVDVFDFGASTLLQKTLTTYATLGAIKNRPSNVTVQDGNGNNKSSTSWSNFDPHGNPQTIAYEVSPQASLTETLTYTSTGQVQTVTDVNGAVATYAYNMCNGAFPTSVSIGGLTTNMQWDCNGGVETSSADSNSKSTVYGYADPYWRVTSITDPLLNATNIIYTPTSVEKSMLFNGNSSVDDTVTAFDGLGRTSVRQTKQSPNSGAAYDSTQIAYGYGSTGAFTDIYVPYQATSLGQVAPTGTPFAVYQNDAMERPYIGTDAGLGTVSLVYTQNDVLNTLGPAPQSEHAKQRQMQYDGLGRLTSVCELTTISGYVSCGQTSPANGYWTTYGYDAPARTMVVTQNALGIPSQNRSYTYDELGRLTSESNPETGIKTYVYDSVSDGTCISAASDTGSLVQTTDARGDRVCTLHDALHHVISVTTQGPDAAVTPDRYFVYNSAIVNGQSMANAAGRIAEAYTVSHGAGAGGTKITDEGFSYSARGELSDLYQHTSHSGGSGGYYHTTATYWANGVPSSLGGIGSQGTYTFNVDGEGRPYSATQGATTFVTSTVYNNASQPVTVSLQKGDSDNYLYDPNTARMTKYTFTVGSTPKSMVGTLNWNANGTLRSLAISDGFNSAGTQTCNIGSSTVAGYDDIGRMISVNCGSSWGQTFSYDVFGNITKTGSQTWACATCYNGNNQYNATLSPMISYDSAGNLTNDTFHTYTWDAYGDFATADTTTTLAHDAFGATVEKNVSGAYSEIEYSPIGKVAVMNGSTQKQAYVPLPGGVILSPGPDTFWHTDWLGSARLASSASQRTVTFDRAFAPFGELYNTVSGGTSNPNFTGDTQDAIGGEYNTLHRELSPVQGRWLSPDPGGINVVSRENPQSWNRYAYVSNMPDHAVDPLGLRCTIYALGVTDKPGSVTLPPGGEPAAAYPYADMGLVSGVMSAGFGYGGDTSQLSVLLSAYASESGGIDLVGFSGGAQTIQTTIEMDPGLAANVVSTTYLSPGINVFGGSLFEASDSMAYRGSGFTDFFATLGARLSGAHLTKVASGHSFEKEYNSPPVQQRLADFTARGSRGPCSGGPQGGGAGYGSDPLGGEWDSFTISGWIGQFGDAYVNYTVWFWNSGVGLIRVQRE